MDPISIFFIVGFGSFALFGVTQCVNPANSQNEGQREYDYTHRPY